MWLPKQGCYLHALHRQSVAGNLAQSCSRHRLLRVLSMARAGS